MAEYLAELQTTNYDAELASNDYSADLSETVEVTEATSYNVLTDKPSINNVTLEGNLTSEDLGIQAEFPEEGRAGDILTKVGNEGNAVAWVTPANNAEQDNTRPITAAAVYTEIGNINALLATI